MGGKNSGRVREKIITKFFSHVRKTPLCWIWTGCLTKWGYGTMNIVIGNHLKVRTGAHRISWFIHNEPVNDGDWILHKCDNRKCVNPKHLFIGDAKKNSDDMIKKRRHMFGEKHTSAKINERDALEIRSLCGSGINQSDIGKAYGISQMAVCFINTRTNWSHVVDTEKDLNFPLE